MFRYGRHCEAAQQPKQSYCLPLALATICLLLSCTKKAEEIKIEIPPEALAPATTAPAPTTTSTQAVTTTTSKTAIEIITPPKPKKKEAKAKKAVTAQIYQKKLGTKRAPRLVQGYVLTVIKLGKGEGTVKGSLMGAEVLNCGDNCTLLLHSKTKIVLEADASVNSTFKGWEEGSCDELEKDDQGGIPKCHVSLSPGKEHLAYPVFETP